MSANSADQKASPLVGDVGGGPAASAAERFSPKPPPNPPHKGEGLRRLNLPAGATARARHLRRNMTEAERLLWAALRHSLPETHWRRQVPLGQYIADFCSHRARLVVELDGGQHASTADRDATRTAFLVAQGYRVLRFWNNDVTENVGGVLATIAAALPRPSPLVGEGASRSEAGEGLAASAADRLYPTRSKDN